MNAFAQRSPKQTSIIVNMIDTQKLWSGFTAARTDIAICSKNLLLDLLSVAALRSGVSSIMGRVIIVGIVKSPATTILPLVLHAFLQGCFRFTGHEISPGQSSNSLSHRQPNNCNNPCCWYFSVKHDKIQFAPRVYRQYWSATNRNRLLRFVLHSRNLNVSILVLVH